ncbi:hypothetical protein NQ315_000273 [Exocentrus adspersus]|uniref:Uncharacterized protein n=1 Tax=Exocentrus adspersus TaxID=1586481 RepID=A0AAV8VQV3_9CUCU|nr:hypothetical protein NQ315_000273 [Exocentrus adspersus]
MRVLRVIGIVTAIVLLIFSSVEARPKKKHSKAMILRQKETNAVNFIRLAVMRVIYSVATNMGFGEQISGVLNGAFVPPGAEDYDDYDYRSAPILFDTEDEYDY